MKKRITQGRLSFNYNIYKHNFIHAMLFFGIEYLYRMYSEIKLISPKLTKFLYTVNCNFLTGTELQLSGHPSYSFSRPRAKDLQLFFSLICKNSTPTSLQPHRTPTDHDLNKLESKVLLGASTQVSAFLAKWFFIRFLKNTKIFSIILY